jgi:hypothetical protein
VKVFCGQFRPRLPAFRIAGMLSRFLQHSDWFNTSTYVYILLFSHDDRLVMAIAVSVCVLRPLSEVCLLLVATNDEQANELAFTSICFSHSFRVLPDMVNSRRAAERKNKQKSNGVEMMESDSNATLFSKHRTKPTNKILPGHLAHVVVSSPLLADRNVVFSDRRYQLILSWMEFGSSSSSRAQSRSCGSVTLTVETILQQNFRLPLRPDWPITGIFVIYFIQSLLSYAIIFIVLDKKTAMKLQADPHL